MDAASNADNIDFYSPYVSSLITLAVVWEPDGLEWRFISRINLHDLLQEYLCWTMTFKVTFVAAAKMTRCLR